MRTGPRLLGALCAAALVVSACTSSQADPDDDPTATSESHAPSPTEGPSSEVTSADDPFAMPDPVTEEYVDRVVNTLYEEWGAITRELLQQPADPTAITPVETRERIAALFDGPYLRQRLEEADSTLRGDRDGVLPPDEFTQLRIRTLQVKAATSACILLIGDFDRTGTAVKGTTETAALSLAPARPGTTRVGWKINDLTLARDAEGNRLPADVFLEARTDELEDLLQSSCEGGS